MKTPDPHQLQALSDKELLEFFQRAEAEAEDLKSVMSVIKDEFITRLDDKGLDSTQVGDFAVMKVARNSYSGVPIKEARKLGATKTEEKVDGSVIGRLIKKGVKVKGVTQTLFIQIRAIKKND